MNHTFSGDPDLKQQTLQFGVQGRDNEGFLGPGTADAMLGSLASSVRGGARFGAQVCALAPSVARRAASGQQTTELQEGSVHVNGVELYYTESPGSGSGLPTLVALPGALGTAATDFGPQLRDLGNHLKVVSFDPRG